MKRVKELLKLVLANKYIRTFRRIFSGAWFRFISSSFFLSIPVSLFTPMTFMREQRAVMAGKGAYYDGFTKRRKKSSVGLRRNIHRLEKALIMKPRRNVFAKDYIMETVEWYAETLTNQPSNSEYDRQELVWAQNVLTEYFSAVKHTGIIEKAFSLFDSTTFAPQQQDQKPFNRMKPKDMPSYDQLLSLSEFRRSVRWFKEKKVNRDLIDKALLVARQSPTACNRSPYEFRIFDDPETVKQVANTPFGTGGYADNIPAIAVVVGRLDSYFSARDRHAIYIDASLATMGFVYGLETLGVSTCLINWPDFEPLERKMQKMLKLKIHERPIMLVAIGYADSDLVPRSTKKELDTIRRYNFED